MPSRAVYYEMETSLGFFAYIVIVKSIDEKNMISLIAD